MRLVIELLIGFLLVLVEKLVNQLLSGFVLDNLSCYLCWVVKADRIRSGAEHLRKIKKSNIKLKFVVCVNDKFLFCYNKFLGELLFWYFERYEIYSFGNFSSIIVSAVPIQIIYS